jgi:tetratricopeptide (TPR) repeat protein
MQRTDGEIVSEAGTPPRWQQCVDLAYLFEKLGHRQEALFLLQRVARWQPARDGSSAHDCAAMRAAKLLGGLMAELPKELSPRGSTTQAALKWLLENELFRSPDALVRRDVASKIAVLTMQTMVDRARLATLAEPLLVLLDDPEPAVRAEAAASFDVLCSNTLNGKVYERALVYAEALAERNLNLDMQSARRWACLTALGRRSEADEAWQSCLQLMANDPSAERTVSRSHTSIHAWRAARELELGLR